MKLIICTDKDTKYLWQTYINAMKNHIDAIWGWNLTWQREDFKRSLAKYATDLITKDGENIGYVQYKLANKECFINMLILDDKYQSKGLAVKLLKILVDKNNLTTISLKCFNVNKRAYQFYIREGFNVTNEDECFYFLKKNIIV